MQLRFHEVNWRNLSLHDNREPSISSRWPEVSKERQFAWTLQRTFGKGSFIYATFDIHKL